MQKNIKQEIHQFPFPLLREGSLLGLLAFCHSPIHLGTYLCFVQFIIVSCGKVSLMGTAA